MPSSLGLFPLQEGERGTYSAHPGRKCPLIPPTCFGMKQLKGGRGRSEVQSALFGGVGNDPLSISHDIDQDTADVLFEIYEVIRLFDGLRI